jgi:hypothetical protein
MQAMLSVTVPRLAGLLILSFGSLARSTSAEEARLVWAGLEGAVLRCTDPPCDDVADLVGRTYFYDANDLWAELYEFDRGPDAAVIVRESAASRPAHLERITILEHRRTLMPAAPSWVRDANAHYLVIRIERDPQRELMLLVWRPSGLLPERALLFTPADMQQFSHWPTSVQSAVRAQQLLVGMTPPQVAMSRGQPMKRERVTDTTGVSEVWSYGRSVEVFFRGGKVVRVREQMRP